jgi:integrase
MRIAEATELAVRAGQLHPVEAARDMALILVGMAVAARSAEASFIKVPDIKPGENDGLYVAIRKSKKSHREPYVKRGARDATCPVRAWHHWQAMSGIVTGPAFRRCRDGRVRSDGLSPEACSDVVTRAGRRAGITGATFHGLRAGFATAAARAKKDKAEIADQGGWDRNSAALDVYIRRVKVWQNAVTEGIGF